MSEIPRRARVDQWTEAEKAIDAAVQVVERAGADVRLTDAVNLLWAARQSVADFVDGINSRRYWTDTTDIEKLRAENEALRQERDALKAENEAWRSTRQKVRDSFGHRDEDGECLCVYCREDAEGLSVHAADYEIRWLHESQRADAAEAALRSQQAREQALVEKWRDHAETCTFPVDSIYTDCADGLAALGGPQEE